MRGIISDQQPTRPNTRTRVHAALDYVDVKVYCAGFIQIIAEKLGHVYAGNPYSLHQHSLFVAYCKSVETESVEGQRGQRVRLTTGPGLGARLSQ